MGHEAAARVDALCIWTFRTRTVRRSSPRAPSPLVLTNQRSNSHAPACGLFHYETQPVSETDCPQTHLPRRATERGYTMHRCGRWHPHDASMIADVHRVSWIEGTLQGRARAVSACGRKRKRVLPIEHRVATLGPRVSTPSYYSSDRLPRFLEWSPPTSPQTAFLSPGPPRE